MLPYSLTQVRKAGEVIRAYVLGTEAMLLTRDEELVAATDVLNAFRAAHRTPLVTANVVLRQMLRGATVKSKGVVSQRLKRRRTIFDKLKRYPSMSLDRMHDIAGCRAVVESVEKIRAVEARWLKTGRVIKTYDYLGDSKDSGYRGLHLVVRYDDRRVEVQLRTELQHAWGVAVERVGGRLGEDLKSGLGPPQLLEFFRVIGEALAYEERKESVPQSVKEAFEAARLRAAPYLTRPRMP